MKKLIVFTLFLLLTVFAFADTFTIGTGTSATSVDPYYGLYNYSWSKIIYTAAEMNGAGMTGPVNIVSIGFYVGNTPAAYLMSDQRVYARHTTQALYETTDNTYPGSTNFTLHFQDDLTYNGGGWMYITFTTPFNWDGTQNIEFLFENWDTDNPTGYPTFRYTSTTPDYRTVYKGQDASFPSDLTGTRTYSRANIRLVTPTTTAPDAAVAVFPPDMGIQISPTTTLSWTPGNIFPSGYRLSLGTDNPPTNLVNNQDLGNVTTYNPDPDLQISTTYYWKVVPYNTFGDAPNCPVWSFTTHGDATITQLPYIQAFDSVTAPALPFDWLGLIQPPDAAGAVLVTYTSSPHSTPNCVRMYNGSVATTELVLIAPQLATTIPANTVRMKLWVKGGGSNYTLSFGVMSDPANLASYTEVSTISPTTTWLEYTVPFNSYAGTGRYLAIKHGLGGTGRTFYFDDVQIELIAQNDLACTALSGNTTPSMNNATTYTASVFNWGTIAQSAYTVKLFNDDNVELATAPGVACAPGATVPVSLVWTPTIQGPEVLYAKVFLTGDQNTTNDQSPNLNINVMPAGVMVVTVGEGNLQEGVPLEFFYKNSIHEALYYPTELNMYGNITALSFYNNFVTNLPAMPCKFWLGQTNLADLSAGWILPGDGLMLVYDGTIDFPSGENTITIPLQTAFPYTSGNLVLYANRPMDTVYYSSSDNFQAQTVGTTRARKLYSDSVTYDPLNPSAAGTLSGTFAKTSFHMLPLSPDPIFVVNPSSKDFGTVLMNTTHNQTFTILNAGGGTLTINSISIAGSPFFTLQNLPNLPVSLTTGLNATFVGRYLPTAAGTHTATITITDNRGNRMTHTVSLTGTCIDATIYTLPYAQNFDAVTVPALPVDWSSIYQATVTTGYVKTVTTSPHSAPNCVAMYNPTDVNTIAMLIAPPLANTIATNTVRVKFWGKGSAAYHLLVGVMTDPLDPATFALIQDLNVVANWNEYIVSLTGYAGTGRYIAFKHASTAAGQTIYIDDVSFELIAPNDLACFALTGNTTPSVGNATTYSAAIRNWGTATQNTYTVKLFNGNDVELATAPGITVDPDATVQIALNWTPTVEGPAVLYAKVILAGDVNAVNDQSPNLNISVQPAGAIMVTVGDGNLVEGLPLDFYYRNSLHQALYFQNELNVYGNITALTFYNNFVTNLPNMPCKFWLGQTNLTDLSGGWILPTGNLTLVYDGTINFPSGENTITIPLQTPFTYTSGNLVLYANRPYDTTYYNSNDNFKTQTIGTNRGRKLTSDSVTYDPLAPSAAGTLSGNFAKTSFTFVTAGFATLNGTVTSGGNPVAGVDIALSTPTVMHQITAADGTYNFPFVLPGTYTVTATKLGYDTQTLPVTLVADQTTTLNINLVASSTVSVSGMVYGSDAPTVGLADVTVTLDGPLDYTGTSNATGQFTITGVLSGNTYNYTLEKGGYQTLTGSIVVGATNYDMGSLTMLEVAMPPRSVTATVNTNPIQVNLTWRPPGSGGAGGVEDFETSDGGWVPTSNWTNPLGDWQWGNNYNVANYTDIDTYVDAPPATAHSGTGMWGTVLQGGYSNCGGWSYLRKTFNLSGVTDPELRFWHYMDGYNTWDYGLIKVNGTTVWGSSALAEFMPWQELVVDLTAYANNPTVEISFEWYATSVVSYAGWYIDDLYVGPAMNRSIGQAVVSTPVLRNAKERDAAELAELAALKAGPGSYGRTASLQLQPAVPAVTPDTRTLFGYRVWRLLQGQETNEALWTSLTPANIVDTTFVDSAWATLPDGNYKWAVKGVYTNNVLSVPALSNMLPILRNDLAALSLNGNVTPTTGAASTYIVQVKNMGTDPQQGTAYTVKLMSGTTELSSVPGVLLAPNATHDFSIAWTPAAAGAMSIFGKVVLTGDSVPANDQTAPMNVIVQPAGVFGFTVGEENQTARIPIDMYYRNSMHQYLIYPAELSNTIGTITGLAIYNQFTEDLLNMPINVWIGTTTAADLSGGWIPSTQLTQVYNGTLNFPTGSNTIVIPFNNPYLYLNGENLVLFFNRPMDTQYYDSTDYFKAQTGTQTTRARNIYSDSTTYDPAAPPATGGTNTGQFPQTTFYIIPGGVGHLTGTVTGAGGAPLEGVVVQFATGGYGTTTNAQGQYTINNILPGTYTVNFSVYGYVNASQQAIIQEDQTTTLNVSMTPMATVNVTGTVLASDTTAGISGAQVHLVGYANYDVNTIATGAFTIPNVYANQSYAYVIMAPGYIAANGTINVGSTNYSMGNITLSEIAYAPHSVMAAVDNPGTAVNLTWQAPDPNAIEITEGFEGGSFPPQNWTQTITNTGPAGTSGVFPTWCRFGSITISGQQVAPTEGSYQAGLWWDYAHQDEWLITPNFNCPPSGYLNFDSYVFLGSTNADHYYVKVSADNGSTWTSLWDASAQTGGWNYYASPINVDLGLYGGQQIKLAFHATDGPTNDGLWYVWFIDDIYIGNALTASANPAETIRFSFSDLEVRSSSGKGFAPVPLNASNPSRALQNGSVKAEPSLPFGNQTRETTDPGRALVGYKVWRLGEGQETNEAAWTSLHPGIITALNITDTAWQTLPNGSYRWAVKGVYTNDVFSVPSFSNILVKVQETGMIAGVVRRTTNAPIQGATVTANGVTATTNTAGAYTLVLPVGNHDVTCSAAGFISQIIEDVPVSVNQTTTLNFVMIGVANDDDVIPVTETALLGNYPNPFNPETTISYSVKDAASVRIEIFNSKGQHVRTLVDEIQASGWYSAVWNGRDDNGRPVSSGVYMYRMNAGNYHKTRKMILMQ